MYKHYIVLYSKQNSKIENQETSLIDVVESVYGDPSNFNDSENFEATLPTQKRKSISPLWFTTDQVEPATDCDIVNSYQKEYTLEYNGIDPNMDATDLLFLSYSKTLKTLSRKRQIQVKMKISEIMGQAELDEVNEKTCESNHVDSSENNEHKLNKNSPKKLKI